LAQDLPALTSEYRPRHPALGFRLDPGAQTETLRRSRFHFQVYCDVLGDFREVTGELYSSLVAGGAPGQVPNGAHTDRHPLVALSPILAGPIDDYRACRYVAGRLSAAGISAFWVHQEDVILDGRRDAVDFEARLRQNLRDYEVAIDLLSSLPEVDPARLGSFGISLGAIKNVVLIAVEPRLRANVLCLAGGRFDQVLRGSQESLVKKYLEGRLRLDGLSEEAVAAEVQRELVAEPAFWAQGVGSDRVLLFLGCLDNKVPYESGLRLRGALGGPETFVLPLGHYTSVLALPWAVGTAIVWMNARWDPPEEP
jgi:hypothetical protein